MYKHQYQSQIFNLQQALRANLKSYNDSLNEVKETCALEIDKIKCNQETTKNLYKQLEQSKLINKEFVIESIQLNFDLKQRNIALTRTLEELKKTQESNCHLLLINENLRDQLEELTGIEETGNGPAIANENYKRGLPKSLKCNKRVIC